jgi:hypothetical protein
MLEGLPLRDFVMVRFGFSAPSLSKRIAARTSIKRLAKTRKLELVIQTPSVRLG